MDDEGGQGATRARPMIELQDTPTGTDPVQLLLVSGDPGTRATVASLLAAQAPAAAIQQAEGVEEALVALEAGGVGAVLLDVACDATGRLAALQRIRSASTHCPVLVLCDRYDEDESLRALGMGAQDYLALDPTDGQALARSLRHALERHRLLGALLVARHRAQFMATHDPLTQLANRTLLEEHLKRALPQARRSGHQVALVLLDIDGFKALNDTLGHELGDEVLVQVGRRLSAGTRRGDLVARLGGDEFVVVLHGIDGECAPARVAEKILRRFSEPFLLAGTEYWIGGSIGISVFPSDGERVDELMRNADIALHQARLKGRGQYRFHAESMNARARKRLVVENGLRRALQRDGLRLVYQPRVSAATGEVAGAEALLRWRDPDLGDVPPSEFVPVAEQSGLIAPIGDWVLESAARQLSEWKRAGHQGLRMAVNVSAHQLALDDLHERVAQVVGDAELEPRELILEVTESCLLHDPENVARRLGALARMGFGIVLDDFGAGFSSLTLLRRFPIEGLKIDRLLVKDLPFDSDAAAIVGAILGIARQLDLSAVAEGVETEEQRSFLLGHGCDEIQGFLVSPGLLPEGFLKLLGPARKSSAVPA